MDEWDRLKIAAGIAGVLAFLCIATVLTVFLEGYLAFSGAGGGPRIDGPTQWREASAAALDEEVLHRNIVSAWNLDRQYETVSEFGDMRTRLYYDRDFAAVEGRLNERFATIDNALDFRLYSALHNRLGALEYGEAPENTSAVLDAWVDAYPESHHARIVRGRFYIDLAWYFRGTGSGASVTRENRGQFKKYIKRARDDLEKAHDLNPADPDASALLVKVAMALDLRRSRMEAFYEQALAANPQDLGARINKFYYLLPKWRGSWEEVDEFLLACDRDRRAFPLIGIIRRLADEEMRSRDVTYDVAYHASTTRGGWIQVYIDQLEHTPGIPFLQANVAYYALEAGDYHLAAEYFDLLGDRFPEESKFKDLVAYCEKRAEAYINRGGFALGEEELAWKERAVQAAPHSALANYAYGEALLRNHQYPLGESHLQTATGLDPDYAPPFVSLALLTEATGRPHEARRYAEQALRANPDIDQRQTAEAILARVR